MRFANNIYFVILALYMAYVLYLRKRARKGKRASIFFSSTTPFRGVKDSRALKFANNTKYLKVGAVAFLLLALTRPQIRDVERDAETFGIDVVLTLDVSGSMLAEDFKPQNRLYVAKEVLHEFIRDRHTDRLGLVVFAGKSYTQSPLTTDYNILLNILDEVEINHTDQGTAIGLAISESLNRLKSSKAKSRVVILLTDGENNKGSIDPTLAANLAKALGVRVYTIGIGTAEGAMVPLGSAGKGPARTADGSVLISRLNEDVLKGIAKISGGQYYRATNKDTLLEIYKKIGELEKSKIDMKKYFRYYELFPYFAFLGLMLLFSEIVLTTTRYSTFP